MTRKSVSISIVESGKPAVPCDAESSNIDTHGLGTV